MPRSTARGRHADDELEDDTSGGAMAGEFGDEASRPDGTKLLASFLAEQGAYPARPVQPWRRTALRAALWGSVVLGLLGGLVGLFSLSGGDDATVEAQPVVERDPGVPAPVGSMAELVVEEWLVTTEAEPSRLAGLFVEQPALAPEGSADWRQVTQARTVAAEQVVDGYWAVTVMVELVDWDGSGSPADVVEQGEELSSVADTGEDGAADDAAGASGGLDLVTWYVEVGIVGEGDGALAALRTPAVLPVPAEVAAGWSSVASDAREVPLHDPAAEQLEGFLLAVLAGEGDHDRYLSPEAGTDVVTPADPPLFADLELTGLVVEDESEAAVRAQLFVEAVTAAGTVQPLAYEVVAEWRGDRLEVVEFWGAASLRGRPEEAEGDLPVEGLPLDDLDVPVDPAAGNSPQDGRETGEGASP